MEERRLRCMALEGKPIGKGAPRRGRGQLAVHLPGIDPEEYVSKS